MLECFLCRRENKYLEKFDNIQTCTLPMTKKPMKAAILHLTKSMKTKITIPVHACVCRKCFNELRDFDEFTFKLLIVQKRLTRMIEKIQDTKEIVPNNAEGDADQTRWYDIMEPFEHVVPSIDEDDISIPDIDVKEENENKDFELGLPTTSMSIKVPCKECKKVFKCQKSLLRHIEKQHRKCQNFKCTICGFTVKDEEYLDLHMNLHEGKTEKQCRYCLKQYTRKVNVIRHMQKHWDKKKFQCEKCGLRFSETTVLYNHKLQHEAEEAPLICEICNQSFKTKRTYKGHIMTHREDRPRYSCSFCTKTFVEKYTLKVHQRTHEKNKLIGDRTKKIGDVTSDDNRNIYSCIICGDEFISKDQYNQHIQINHDVILRKKDSK